ncbi:hypothetical protein ACXNSR_38955 (plasmid) [Streptomyces sp. NC-S4]
MTISLSPAEQSAAVLSMLAPVSVQAGVLHCAAMLLDEASRQLHDEQLRKSIDATVALLNAALEPAPAALSCPAEPAAPAHLLSGWYAPPHPPVPPTTGNGWFAPLTEGAYTAGCNRMSQPD